MREQGVDAGPGLGFVEDEFGLTVFLPDGVVALDFHGAERIAGLQDPVANPEIVTSVENAERQARDYQRAFHAAKYRLERFPLPRSSELRFAPARESGASHVWEP
jgi:hypothetical protein